jgi:hypothetical protein
VETETDLCGAVACNPMTKECTGAAIGSLDVCDQCVADSECGDGFGASEAFRCVQLDYQGNPFPSEGNGYCLQSVSEGGSCSNPYRIVILRSSLSGEDPDEYCGINEELATCPAVRALLEDTSCDPASGNADCPQPAGLCRELPGAVFRCTYQCESIVECATPGSTCGRGDTESDEYCGG